MRMYDIIMKKRNFGELSKGEIDFLIEGEEKEEENVEEKEREENILIDKKTYTLSFTFLSVSDYTSVDEPIYAYMLDTIRFYDSEK